MQDDVYYKREGATEDDPPWELRIRTDWYRKFPEHELERTVLQWWHKVPDGYLSERQQAIRERLYEDPVRLGARHEPVHLLVYLRKKYWTNEEKEIHRKSGIIRLTILSTMTTLMILPMTTIGLRIPANRARRKLRPHRPLRRKRKKKRSLKIP